MMRMSEFKRRDGAIHPTVIGICSNLILMGTALVARAQADPFPGDIFALRPPHVRVSEPGESAVKPRGGRYFPYYVVPPAIPAQEEVRLTNQDQLTLVYPSSGGSYSSGGSVRRDRLRIDGRQLLLDIFHIPISFSGDALVPPAESAIFLGQLGAGEYDVAIRTWYLPPAVLPWLDPGIPLPDFDPETFEPPENVIVYVPPAVPPSGIYATFSPPFLPWDPPVVVPSSFRFTVLAVPEPSLFSGLSTAVLYIGLVGRIGSRRRL